MRVKAEFPIRRKILNTILKIETKYMPFLPTFIVIVIVSVVVLFHTEQKIRQRPVTLDDFEPFRWASLLMMDLLITSWFM